MRHRALTIATISTAAGGLFGVFVHFLTKGSAYWGVPMIGTFGAVSSCYGILVSKKYKSVRKGGAIASIFGAYSMMILIVLTDGLRSSLLPMLCGLPGFAALFWGPRGALWILGSVLSLLAILGLAEYFAVMPHGYFGPYPDLQNAGFVVSVFNSLMMVGVIGFFYVREQNAIKHLIIYQTRQADEAKTRFLANITHELRTPLNGISGINALMEIDETDPMRKKYLQTIRSSVAELDGLIANLLIAASQSGVETARKVQISTLMKELALSEDKFTISIDPLIGEVTIPIETVKNILRLATKAAIQRNNSNEIEIEVSLEAHSIKWYIEDQTGIADQAEFDNLLKSYDRQIGADGAFTSNAKLGLGFINKISEPIGAEFTFEKKQDRTWFKLSLPLH